MTTSKKKNLRSGKGPKEREKINLHSVVEVCPCLLVMGRFQLVA